MEIEMCEGIQKKLGQLEENLEKITREINNMQDLTNEIWDMDLLEQVKKGQPKLPKKEREKIVLAHFKERYPKIVQLFSEIDEFIEAINIGLADQEDKLEDTMEKIGDIEDLKEQVKDALND